jgi:hypothetical protein
VRRGGSSALVRYFADDRDSLTVGDAVIAATGGLPAQIRQSLPAAEVR